MRCAFGYGRGEGKPVEEQFYITDLDMVESASEMIARFGEDAGIEAAVRADRYRDIGNAVSFCRWRQIERVISVLTAEQAIGTIH